MCLTSALSIFREVKVRVLKSDPLAWVTGSLIRRKTSTESFLLTLIKVTYIITDCPVFVTKDYI